MESKNPDAMDVDTRTMAEKMKDDGNEPTPRPNDQVSGSTETEPEVKDANEITDDEAKEMANSCPHISQMLSELGQYNVKSVDDVKRIEEIINRYELYRKYGA